MITINDINSLRTTDREATIAAHRQARADQQRLEDLVSTDHMTGRTPEDTISTLEAEIGHDRTAAIVATLVNATGDWDARIWPSTRRWAESISDAYSEEAAREFWLIPRLHPCHLNQLGQAMMKH